MKAARFTAIDSHTAVITSEYSMECLKEWLEECTPITEKQNFEALGGVRTAQP